MFGYVRPFKDELKVREFEDFKAEYCALCHTLKSRYGRLSRNILSYDFVFLAMLLTEGKSAPEMQCARCTVSPVRKKRYCAPSQILDLCAGYSVILTWWKLCDSISDERFYRSFGDRFKKLMLHGAYKNASRAYSGFAGTVRENLTALSQLEKLGNGSLDACADKFAHITEALASAMPDEARNRPLRQLLYHTGRYIYIIDACDDFEDDLKNHRYNPIANRFKHTEGVLSEEEKNSLRITLLHSCALIAAAYELLPKSFWSQILSNIIYLGMPAMCEKVLAGALNKGMDKII
jgi:hypothetical protein